MTLDGKTAIVTGAASSGGIGFAVAKMFAESGALVVLTDVNEAQVAARGAELTAAGHSVLALRHDVCLEDDWVDVVTRTMEQFGRIDVLVNNAGVAMVGSLEAMTLGQWNRQQAVNATSVFLGSKFVAPKMRESAGGGSIINVSSVSGISCSANTAAYAASKGSVRLFSKAAAIELAPGGIRVNSIHPGVIVTDLHRSEVSVRPGVDESLCRAIPLGRLGQPSDVAAVATFLASDGAQYITGSEIVVDGGVIAQQFPPSVVEVGLPDE
jgi:NAD(P)-dependent dehydrogenase (short-subunit alcohol dehydrogenase family)